MFETNEMVYRMGMNYLKNKKDEWLVKGIELIKRDKDKDKSKGFNQLSTLFTVYRLYLNYPDRFKGKLSFYCEKFKTNYNDFIEYRKTYHNELQAFEKEYGEEKQLNVLKLIRNNKKLHFHKNSGTVKLSTIHSFKGWESEMLFLILEKKFSKMEMSFNEILYTGITRCRANLILINFGNEEYHDKLKEMIGKVK
ncbi:MAG: hypothetical protein CO118_00525 [Flavobacteriales bacterium CG_4_9_14_3_um_filter_32_8]|nr:MAG: hypothetical protein CO118_00525 [Flavobacteriales bacterium CG_4_9_14_3_um_filter_32_8]